MITKTELKTMAKAKLRDARLLYRNKRYDGAAYLCGYSIELALKARICRTIQWPGFPETRKEFENFQSFRTHDLDTLLHLSGVKHVVLTRYVVEWSAVQNWNPEHRYNRVGSTTEPDVKVMIDAAASLLRVL